MALEVTALLLKGGADLLATDEDGKASLDHARERGHEPVLALLHGAAASRVGVLDVLKRAGVARERGAQGVVHTC